MEYVITFFRDILDGPVYIIVSIISGILICSCIGYLAEQGELKKKKKVEDLKVNLKDASNITETEQVKEEQNIERMPEKQVEQINTNSSSSSSNVIENLENNQTITGTMNNTLTSNVNLEVGVPSEQVNTIPGAKENLGASLSTEIPNIPVGSIPSQGIPPMVSEMPQQERATLPSEIPEVAIIEDQSMPGQIPSTISNQEIPPINSVPPTPLDQNIGVPEMPQQQSEQPVYASSQMVPEGIPSIPPTPQFDSASQLNQTNFSSQTGVNNII